MPSSLPQHLDGHREKSRSRLLNTLTVMEKDAASEAVTRRLLQTPQSPEVFGTRGRACLDLDPDDAAR